LGKQKNKKTNLSMRLTHVLLALSLAVFVKSTMDVWSQCPNVYMDEQFHAAQTQRYCAGAWRQWDSKITTLPGLYVAGRAWAWLFNSCDLWTLRMLSVFAALCNVGLCALLFRVAKEERLANAVALCLVPIHAFFAPLYYTDTLSLTLVLAVYVLAARELIATSALCAFLAVLCRQTNVLWVGFIAAERVLDAFSARRKLRAGNDSESIARSVVATLRARAKTMLCFGCVGLAFAAFVVLNGGIVVGDRNAHQATLHWAQLCYGVAFIGAMLWPHLVFGGALARAARSVRRRPWLFALLWLLAFAALRFGSIAHPYLLADNRHYTFYLHKDVLNVPAVRLVVSPPLYAFGAMALYALLAERQGALWVALYACVASLSVLFSALLEFRYFLLAYTMARLRVHARGGGAPLCIELLQATLVHALTSHVFAHRPFTAPDDATGRFMW
jgi:alpha-1,2-glucosyltransferase